MSKRRDKNTDPRKVGGRYFSSYWRQEYEVIALDPDTDWGLSITVRWDDRRVTNHSTGWDKHDHIIVQP